MDLPTEKFKNLCSEILKNFTDFNVVFSGSNDDLEKTNKMLSEFNESERKRIFNLAGTLNLKELMILIDSSKLFISNSTGPIHIAGALNKNIIGFYPDKIPMNSERWRPLSENAIILKPKIPEDMNSISNEDIISSVQNILNKK
jgi:ADP-heptose:LPS heptosyltransferase